MDFQKNFRLENSIKYVREALLQQSIAGDGPFTAKCSNWLKSQLKCQEVLMTTSCTHALELAVRALCLNAGDEVILPSFTYPSTANAVILSGGQVVYSECEAQHLNIDPNFIEEKITSKTRGIIVVHYGGVACDMDQVMEIANRHGLIVIEDAAQALFSTYKGRALGTIGHLGCLSFHGSKDVVAGEGGALLINDESYLSFCQVFRLKGTNRDAFISGQVPYYEWVSPGSSYSPSDVLMAILLGQLEESHTMLSKRRIIFERYRKFFKEKDYDTLEGFSQVESYCMANGHLFYMLFKSVEKAKMCQLELGERAIPLYTHFVPLHESRLGQGFIRSINHFEIEKNLGKRLLRLPIYPDLTEEDQSELLEAIDQWMKKQK